VLHVGTLYRQFVFPECAAAPFHCSAIKGSKEDAKTRLFFDANLLSI